MKIRFVPYKEIHRLKWDSCVHYATNGNPYAYTWYLDNVCENWDGLVEGDYESVFPLVWNKKLLGYKQLYQPPFSQQLGIYSVNVMSLARRKAFLEAIPEEYRYVNIQLNDHNIIPEDWGFKTTKRPNFLVDLNRSYEEISSKYSKNLKRSLKKANQFKFTATTNVKPEKLVALFNEHQGSKIDNWTEKNVHMAHRIIYNALHRGLGFISGIEDENGELLAASFFLSSHRRFYNILPASTPKGRECRAMHVLIDLLIRMNVNKPMFLDFEGSSIESIARFYKQFGVIDRPYYRFERNTLPWFLKMLK